jgi:hypothetical protein
LGRLLFQSHGIPYGIDYIDPWVSYWPGFKMPFSRAWASHQLSRVLEPWSVKDAALITGVAPGYYEGMLQRNPDVARRAVAAAMPYGGSERDFEFMRTSPRPTFLWNGGDGLFHLIYAGALLPAGIGVLEVFLGALAHLRGVSPETARRLRVHFVGTGRSPTDKQGHQVLPRARTAGVEDLVTEHPHRIGYVDTLNHLVQASAVLVLGSTERHYTPSKLFLAVLSRRPVLAVLHEASTAVDLLAGARAGRTIVLPEGSTPDPALIAGELQALVERPTYDPNAVDWSAFEAYSARNSARLLAAALDRTCARLAAAG